MPYKILTYSIRKIFILAIILSDVKRCFALLFCSFLFACQKPFLGPEDITVRPSDSLVIEPPVQEDSIALLDEISFYEYEANPPYRWKTQRFFYDSLKRVEHINTYFFSTVDSLFSIDTYHYRGDDSLAFMKTTEYPGLLPPDNFQTEYYTYNSQGKLSLDSLVNGVFRQTFHISYGDPYIFLAVARYDLATGDTYSTADTAITNSSGNIERIKHSDFSVPPEEVTYLLKYDNMYNPLAMLNIRSTYVPLYDFADEIVRDPLFIAATNNVTHITEALSTVTYTSEFSYDYSAVNLPVRQYFTRDRYHNINTQLFYTYRKL